MADILNTQQKRLYDALCACAGERAAEDIALKQMLPKNPSDARKADWAADVCRDMEEKLDADTVKRARMACHCKPPLNKFASVKRAYERSLSLEEYARLMDEKNEGASFWLENGDVYMSYPRCYCSFVSKAARDLPASWCACSVGYVKALNDYLLNTDTNVELIKSIVAGGERCVFKISVPRV